MFNKEYYKHTFIPFKLPKSKGKITFNKLNDFEFKHNYSKSIAVKQIKEKNKQHHERKEQLKIKK